MLFDLVIFALRMGTVVINPATKSLILASRKITRLRF